MAPAFRALMPPPALLSERLQKLIAATGLCSRRRAEDLLRAGRVRVNGRPASLGDRADPDRDRILVDGRPLRPANASLTLLLHKPVGVLSSCRDPQGRPTVLDLLPEAMRQGIGLHPVGRLDGDSRGALLLSNDGRLTLRLTHPRYGHAKTYRVRVAGQPGADVLEAWRRGLPLDGVPSQPVRLRQLHQGPQDTWLELVMREGRNRQIRRTAALLGHPVRDLQRTAIGRLGLGDLPEGAWRPLRPAELEALLRPDPLHPDPPDPALPNPELPNHELRYPDPPHPDPFNQDRWPAASARPSSAQRTSARRNSAQRTSARRNSPRPTSLRPDSPQPDSLQPNSPRPNSPRPDSRHIGP
jgi:pseudouridine synthase